MREAKHRVCSEDENLMNTRREEMISDCHGSYSGEIIQSENGERSSPPNVMQNQWTHSAWMWTTGFSSVPTGSLKVSALVPSSASSPPPAASSHLPLIGLITTACLCMCRTLPAASWTWTGKSRRNISQVKKKNAHYFVKVQIQPGFLCRSRSRTRPRPSLDPTSCTYWNLWRWALQVVGLVLFLNWNPNGKEEPLFEWFHK